MSNETDLAWLAGFVDGEGHVSVHSNSARWFQATIGIRNTHLPSLEHASDILDSVGVSHGLYHDARAGAQNKDSHWLNVTGMENVRHLARLLLPYSVTKRRQLGLTIEWCDSRLNRVPRSGGYSDAELLIATEFKTINKRGKLAS